MIEISLGLAVAILIFIAILFWVGVACGIRLERQEKKITRYVEAGHSKQGISLTPIGSQETDPFATQDAMNEVTK